MDFDKINIDAVSYNVKDSTARQQIGDEVSAREAADTTLGQQITEEAKAREAADTELGQQITALGQQITEETEAREAADTALGQQIANAKPVNYGLLNMAASYIGRVVFPATDAYHGQQGICVIDKDTYILCTINPSGSDSVTLRRVGANCAVRATNVITPVTGYGHANSATYNRGTNEMLIAGDSGLCRVNPSTLSIIDYVSLGAVTGVAYDPVNNKIAVRNAATYRILNATTYAVEKTFTASEPSWLTPRLNADPWVTARQGLVYYNGLVGCLYYNPNLIVFYDDSGKVVSIYNIPTSVSSMYYTREIEDGEFLPDGTCIMVSAGAFGGRRHYRALIFEISPETNKINNKYNTRIERADSPIGLPNYYYVSASASANNPDGSASNPFRYIQEAVEAAILSNLTTNMIVQCNNAGDYGALMCVGIAFPLRIVGYEGAVVWDATFERCSLIDARTINFRLSDTTRVGVVLVTGVCKAHFNACTFGNTGDAKVNYDVSASRSDVACVGCSFAEAFNSYALDLNVACIGYCCAFNNAVKVRARSNSMVFTDDTTTTNYTMKDSLLVTAQTGT